VFQVPSFRFQILFDDEFPVKREKPTSREFEFLALKELNLNNPGCSPGTTK
jgi:hypothetical protein